MANEPLVHTCPGCGTLIDVTEVEPYSQVYCPTCGVLMRVRTRFGHFEILEFIASGGMGSVFKARDVNLNRIVALKLLRKDFSADAAYIEKLETEAKITASVAHPFVVKVFSFGCDQGVYSIAMELVDKGSLDDLISLQGRVAEAQVLSIGLQVAQGLRAAYRVGLIHRDVKPGNILFADAHTAKIVDFGLAAPIEQAQGEKEIWGTPYYVAPEKLNHEPEDFRSDIYSLGGTLFHALSGRPPFEAENASLVALKHLKSQAVSLQAFAPDVSSPTAYVINRMLAKNPGDRYQSYDELIEHLEYARAQLLESAGKVRQPKTRVVVEDEKQQSAFGYIMMAAIALVLIAGAGLYFFKDSLISRRTGATAQARQQMSHSAHSVDQILVQARKQTVAGDVQGALKTLRQLDNRPNLTTAAKIWIPVHECVTRLAAGQAGEGAALITRLMDQQAYRTGDRSEEEPLRRFLGALQHILQSRDAASDPEINRWSTERFEPMGYLVAGLKEWDASRFESASALFQQFLEARPKGGWAWIDDFKPLARAYRDDYAAFTVLQVLIETADTPEKKAAAARQIPGVRAQLKLPGRLPEKLSKYEITLRSAP